MTNQLTADLIELLRAGRIIAVRGTSGRIVFRAPVHGGVEDALPLTPELIAEIEAGPDYGDDTAQGE